MSPPALGAKPDIVRTPPYHFVICDRLIPDESDMAIAPLTMRETSES
jgi:hypothetical protein